MAEGNPVRNLCDETSCPVCLEYFKDPVTTDCGHNFCQACITQCWGDPEKAAVCPQCREPCQQRNFRPNRQLVNFVEIAKKFSLQMARGAEALGPVCERHQEPLKLFCQDDQAPICVVCDRSKEHREHKMIPKEEAFEEYMDKMMCHLTFLNNERQEILSFKLTSETESQDLLEKTERERQKIMSEFKQLHQFLEEQEHLLLSQLKDLDDEIKSCRDSHLAQLSKDISSLDSLIKEMEEKQKQTANEFLQDLKNILQRCNKKKCVNSTAFPPEINRQIESFSQIHPSLETVMKNFKDTVLFTLQEDKELLAINVHVTNQDVTSFCMEWSQPKIAVDAYKIRVKSMNKDEATKLIWLAGTEKKVYECKRLNPSEEYRVTIQAKKGQCYGPPSFRNVMTTTTTKDMPIPTLILSTEDSSAAHQQLPESTTNLETSVKQFQTQVTPWNVFLNPTKLCRWSSVMGVERIMSGSHSWVVDVGAMKVWAVGMAKESVRHYRSFSHNQGLWAIGISHNGTYSAFSSSKMFLKSYPFSSERALVSSLSGMRNHFRKNLPKRIQVSLNYEGRSVTFVDCADNATIHTFLNVSFSGEEISSWFSVGKCAN